MIRSHYERDYREEYDNYQGTEKQKKNRASGMQLEMQWKKRAKLKKAMAKMFHIKMATPTTTAHLI